MLCLPILALVVRETRGSIFDTPYEGELALRRRPKKEMQHDTLLRLVHTGFVSLGRENRKCSRHYVESRGDRVSSKESSLLSLTS